MMMKKPILILFPVLFCACVSVGYAADKLPALPDIKGYGDDAAARQKSRQALDAASQAAKHGAVR
ncbi:MAG: hypothetical protein B7Y33_00455, partial [Hydrogenophilales bacterium 16-62-9]